MDEEKLTGEREPSHLVQEQEEQATQAVTPERSKGFAERIWNVLFGTRGNISSIEETRAAEEKLERNAFLQFFSREEDETVSSNPIVAYFGFPSNRKMASAAWFEVKQVFHISWPMIINFVCYALMGFTDLAFVGHLGGEKYMAAAALGNAYSYCLAFAAFGMASGMDTLTSQAYGAKNFRLINIILFQAIFVISISCVPLIIACIFSEQFFLLIRQDPEISKLAGEFVRLLLFGLLPGALVRTLQRNLMNQRIVIAPMIIAIFVTILNVGLNYVFIFGIGFLNGFGGLGFIGAPISTSVCRVVQLVMMIVLHMRYAPIRCLSLSEIKETFHPKGLWQYLKFAVPGMIQLVMEVWGFQLTTIFSGYLDAVSISANAIILNLTVITFMLPMGISIAGSVRVGNMLGAGIHMAAKFSASIALFACIMVMVVNALLMIITRSFIGYLFTNSQAVIQLVSWVVFCAASFQIFDGAQACANGILRGIGKQHFGAIMNFIAYYIIGIPLGLVLAFWVGIDLFGIWIGLAVGLAVDAIVLGFVLLIRTDWEKQAQEAKKRVSASEDIDEPLSPSEQARQITELEQVHIHKNELNEEDHSHSSNTTTTLWTILNNPESLSLMKQFAIEEFSHDNVTFWEKVQEWKSESLTPQQKHGLKQRIFDTYISPYASCPLGFSSAHKQQLVELFTKHNTSLEEDERMLDFAVSLIIPDLMDIYYRFRQRPITE